MNFNDSYDKSNNHSCLSSCERERKWFPPRNSQAQNSCKFNQSISLCKTPKHYLSGLQTSRKVRGPFSIGCRAAGCRQARRSMHDSRCVNLGVCTLPSLGLKWVFSHNSNCRNDILNIAIFLSKRLCESRLLAPAGLHCQFHVTS